MAIVQYRRRFDDVDLIVVVDTDEDTAGTIAVEAARRGYETRLDYRDLTEDAA